MQFLLVLPLLNHFIQLCVLVLFLIVTYLLHIRYILLNYYYDFWLATKRLLVDDETTLSFGDETTLSFGDETTLSFGDELVVATKRLG